MPSPHARRPTSPAAFRWAIFRWFAAHGRDLPWRRTRDPWRVLVSEVMLQQTQVDRVIPKYLSFVRRWPTPAAMARAPLRDVLSAWSGLGYNRRAAHLKAAAETVVRAHGGVMPADVEALEALPGVGRYTARAVASFAYGQDVALWDTNVRRIALRVFRGGEFADADPGREALERLLADALPSGRSRDWHGALMDFGSAVCVSRNPLCASCPLRGVCLAAPRFLEGERPPRRLARPQARFAGSRREARGKVVRMLAAAGKRGASELAVVDALEREDAGAVIGSLVRDGLVVRKGRRLALP